MGLILLSIDSSTLSLVAILVVMRDLTSALLGSAVGAYVDRCAWLVGVSAFTAFRQLLTPCCLQHA